MLATLGFRALSVAARSVPPCLGHPLCRAGATLYHGLARSKRTAVAANLRQVEAWSGTPCDPSRLRELTRRTFEHHTLLLYEWLRGGADVRLAFEGIEYLEAARAAGRGAIIATCHLGNWEVAAVELARRGFKLNVVTGEQLGSLGGAVRARKEGQGIRVIRPSDGMRTLYNALRQGEIVALLIDGDVYTQGRATEFFDGRAELPFGAARLAQRTGADLIAAAMMRITPDTYRVRILPPVARSNSSDAMMDEVLRALEPMIAEVPEQWCLFRQVLHPATGGAAA